MKAAILKEIGKPLTIEDIPVPAPGFGEVLVETRACGICATDLHIHAGWGYTPSLPFVMGHEPAGVVAEVGEGVTEFKRGDRVIPNIFMTCGRCRYCLTANETLCTSLRGILGVINFHGGYAEFFKVPATQLFHLPESVSFADGAVIADAVVCAVHAAKRKAKVRAGDAVLIIGAGGVGLSVLQVAKLAGARTFVVDVTDEKVELAKEIGADEALNSRKTRVPEWIRELTYGKGVEIVFDCHGSEDTLSSGVDSLAPEGKLVIIGYTQERYHLQPQQISRREIQIIGSRSGGRQDTAEAINIVASGRWKSIVSDTYPLERINEAFEFLKSGRALGRIVINVKGENN